ncbi:MAG: hypothetical protein J6M62_11825 [Selenomonadaceae bacterium]|nr:hypothetical protein [Selenomonadaceae bacterium]
MKSYLIIFFSEEKLLRYCENNKHISFYPSSKAYTILYRHLRTYIDSEKEKMPLPVFAQEIEQILAIEKIITIAHGTELDENEVINEMKKIPIKKCWGCLRYIIVFHYKKKYFRSYT